MQRCPNSREKVSWRGMPKLGAPLLPVSGVSASVPVQVTADVPAASGVLDSVRVAARW